MAIGYRFASRAEATTNGWFSRRHQTSQEHVDAQSAKLALREQRLLAGRARDVAARLRSPADQIVRLDKMFGKGVGAVRERARLKARLGAK